MTSHILRTRRDQSLHKPWQSVQTKHYPMPQTTSAPVTKTKFEETSKRHAYLCLNFINGLFTTLTNTTDLRPMTNATDLLNKHTHYPVTLLQRWFAKRKRRYLEEPG